MSSDQVRIAEAIASLSARLDGWGVENPQANAHEYVNDMLRNGWRPRARPVDVPLPGRRSDPPPDVLAEARANLAAARADLCRHGVDLDHCHEAHDPEETP